MSQRSRKRKIENEDQTMVDSEQNNLSFDEIKNEIKTMWEIPQISHFLYLTKRSLNISQLSIYEIERMLFIPRASKQLANIMTCLLSSSATKTKLRKIPSMPYEFWTNILAHKVASWFKVYHAKHKNAIKVLETIGVEPEFWRIFPDASVLVDGKTFEDLSFKQRVWLLKTVCDTIMHTRKTVQEDIASQPWQDQFETILGVDRYGARYIYFPQFTRSDLRIYRQCLDNKILSTVKPVGPEQANFEKNNSINTKLDKHVMKKSQSLNNLFEKSNKYDSGNEDKDYNDYKSNNNSATCSFISEDTNLSSVSTCSNRNNINLNIMDRTRSRSLSKMSEESILSNETRSSNAKSSGYDSNISNDNKSFCETPETMFTGFSNTKDDNHNIEIIAGMLDDLKSEINKEKRTNMRESNNEISNSELISQEKSINLCKNTINTNIINKDELGQENKKPINNLSNNSKTDDEKLNEIMKAEDPKLPEIISSKNVFIGNNVNRISLRSKSDDEKLNETKPNSSNIKANDMKNNINKDTGFNELFRVTSNKTFKNSSQEKMSETETMLGILLTNKNSATDIGLNEEKKLQSRYRKTEYNKNSEIKIVQDKEENNKINNTNDKNFIINKTVLKEEKVLDDDLDDYINNSDTIYNLQKSKEEKEDYCKYFNKILSDLSVSDFQLVADSVEGLRNLISHFTSDSSDNDNAQVTLVCEAMLVYNLRELLNSLKEVETTLKDTMRKAKSKLQREWSNLKEGSLEDQDSSSQNGLSSNCWILGSQDCSSPAPGNATLQTLSQSSLSPLGSQNQQLQSEDKHESQITEAEESQCDSQKSHKKLDVETQGRQKIEEKEKKHEDKQFEENKSTSSDEDTEQQTRRVLRARGISSYTEQFSTDDESDEDKLEEWSNIEAVYAASGTQTDTSSSHINSKIRHQSDTDEWSEEEEDSDQDWILPGSRKRKNKRSSTNRKLRACERKIQNIKENMVENYSVTNVPHLVKTRNDKTKLNETKLNLKITDKRTKGMINSPQISDSIINKSIYVSKKNLKQVVPDTKSSCAKTDCDIEVIDSVHSELNIKDEGPIYESSSDCHGNNYNSNLQNPINTVSPGSLTRSDIIVLDTPQIPKDNYLRNAQNNITDHLQPNHIPAQQSVFQHQNPQTIVDQPVLNTGSNTTYVVTTTQSQHGITSTPSVSNLRGANHCRPKPQNRLCQSNIHTTMQGALSHSNNAITRRKVSVRNSCQRSLNSKVTQQQKSDSTVASSPQCRGQTSQAENIRQKTTSLIVLSDSDDEIEMIITEKVDIKKDTTVASDKAIPALQKNQPRQKPMITSDVTVAANSIIPPQIIQRMEQGGISLIPVKPAAPASPDTKIQLVVVVNETGSHYALALPNGSKLILTSQQVAQIRASNGGNLIL